MKNSLVAITFAAVTLAANLLISQPSHAFTLEELTQTVEQVGKASGVWQRFIQDLERTQRGSSPRPAQPTRRVEPEIQPQQPAGDNDWIEVTEEFQDN